MGELLCICHNLHYGPLFTRPRLQRPHPAQPFLR
jgi:hypothetical protein